MSVFEHVKIEDVLSDEEWMSILNAEREGLPRCCGNVSALRDAIITFVRAGEINTLESRWFLQHYRNFLDGHDDDELPALRKVRAAVEKLTGVTVESLAHKSTIHTGSSQA